MPDLPCRLRLPLIAATLLAFSFLAGCHRPTQTSAELRQRMPGAFIGELRLLGQPEPMRLRLTPHNLIERDAQTLEFNSVQYALLDAHGGLQTEGDASVRGTITLPGLEVKLEDVGERAGGEDLVKPGSFQGKLSADLQSGEADWTSGLGQKNHLKLEAAR